MSRTAIVISGAITAFILALTAGAVYAYRSLSASGPRAATAANAQQPLGQADSALQLAAPETPTTVPNVSPQDAAALAAKILNRTDLYSVEIADVNGEQAYKVTFSSGEVAFVSLQGQLLSVQTAPTPGPVTNIGGASPQQLRGAGGASGRAGEGESEGDGG